MSRIDEYREALEERGRPGGIPARALGLPGPRANLELARAAADVCATSELDRWARMESDEAPTGTAEEFLASRACSGWQGNSWRATVERSRSCIADASDPRWRIREAVAMALQRWGEADFGALRTAMHEWAHGTWLERRAAAAALCEPALLTTAERVSEALAVLAKATAGLAESSVEERRSEEFRALRKGLGYCWSVAVVAAPEVGQPRSKSSSRGRWRATTAIWCGLRARTCASGGSSASTAPGSCGWSSASNPCASPS